jgi:hypothetical protein
MTPLSPIALCDTKCNSRGAFRCEPVARQAFPTLGGYQKKDPLNEEDPTPGLVSLAPSPTLVDHPEFPFMVVCTLERFRCTLAEIREDYWMGRAWRALSGDPALKGRVARIGVAHVLVTGADYGPILPSARERERWSQRVADRVLADTNHTIESLGLSIVFAEQRVTVGEGCLLSLIAQTVGRDPCWQDLSSYTHDLGPVLVNVAHSLESIVAA